MGKAISARGNFGRPGLGIVVALAVALAGCTAEPADSPDAASDAAPDGTLDTDVGEAGAAVAVVLAPATGIVTSEQGSSATFTVVLSAVPTADVTIAVASSDASEGTVTPAMLRFTPSNALAPQTVTVTGVDDPDKDGDVAYRIDLAAAVSADARFSGLDVPDMPVTNLDDESAGISVIASGGLRTSELGAEVTFAVVLKSKPKADVTLPLASADPSEGTVTPATLTFTPANWNAPQTVTVAGVNDPDNDGDVAYTITLGPSTSSDADYQGLSPPGPTIENVDDETPGLVVTGDNLRTTEAGGQASFTVALRTRPGADVTIPVVSGDVTEGTVAPASLVFTPVNWNAPRTITVTGVNDDVADGNQIYKVNLGPAQSLDADYAGLSAMSSSIANTDDDAPGVTVTAATAPLLTSEAGAQATFTVVLDSRPNANVTIGVSSSDTGEGTVSPATLTFTPENFSAPQTVTVTGVNDAVADGTQVYAIVTAPAVSSDTTGYSGLDPADVVMGNTDDDSAGFVVSAISGSLTEAGGSATFTVALTSQPSASVTIGVASSDIGEATVAPASLTFTADNWNAPQTVTVTGVDDALADGNQVFSIITSAAVSSDTTGYSGLNPANVAVTTLDNDSAGFGVGAISGATTEAGGTATFTVALTSQPTADVVIGLTSSDTGEGTVLPASLTFTTMNWNTPQTVTVTGVDDAILDGNQTFSIVTAAATSTDANFSGLNAADVAVSNRDDDGITVSPTSGLETWEDASTATFTVVLASAPSASVTVAVTSNDTTEGTVMPASLTFTTGNWNTPQTVTVTGVDDMTVDAATGYTVSVGPATSSDPLFSGTLGATVSLTNKPVGNVALVATSKGSSTCAINRSGAAYCWGYNSLGELGVGDNASNRYVPTAVVGGNEFKTISPSRAGCGITSSDQIACWGQNGSGQLGNGNNVNSYAPVFVSSASTFSKLAVGFEFGCALDSTGAAYCWGDNRLGKLGLGSMYPFSKNIPTAVTGGHTFTQLCAGGDFACALDGNGATYCWGDSSVGQLGNGVFGGVFPSPVDTPTLVTGGLTFVELSCMDKGACGLTGSGDVYCWGDNSNAQLGDGTTTDRSVPTLNAGGIAFAKLASDGAYHMCALTSTGAAYCWGWNWAGQLGDGSVVASPLPVAVAGGLRFTRISAGSTHTCGLSHGSVYCWGSNLHGQLGTGYMSPDVLSPTLVTVP